MGRPSKYRKEFHPANFITLSREGHTFAQIAARWDVARETVWAWTKKHKEFSNAVKRGRELAEAWYMDIGRSAMMGQVRVEEKKVNVNLGWFVWMTKNMFKWTDKVVIKDTDHDPTDDPCSDMTDEELEKT